MKPMTLKELADMGHLIGHSGTEIVQTKSGARWSVGCSCGYQSTTRRTRADALEAIVHHLLKAVAAFAATGQPLPDIPIPSEGEERPTTRPLRAVRSAS